MMRAATLSLVIALAGCAFAQKHPAITTGIVAGTLGFSTCFLAVEKPGTCGVVGLGAGVAIGGITGLATTFLVTDAPDDDSIEDPIQRRRSDGPPPGPYLPPDPNPLPATALPDAGVPATPDASGAATPEAP